MQTAVHKITFEIGTKGDSASMALYVTDGLIDHLIMAIPSTPMYEDDVPKISAAFTELMTVCQRNGYVWPQSDNDE
jgi:hypothetical protein